MPRKKASWHQSADFTIAAFSGTLHTDERLRRDEIRLLRLCRSLSFRQKLIALIAALLFPANKG